MTNLLQVDSCSANPKNDCLWLNKFVISTGA
jgi:hypothetical protein